MKNILRKRTGKLLREITGQNAENFAVISEIETKIPKILLQ